MVSTQTLLGSRFATWLGRADGAACVIKSMDVAPPGRETSLCWREFVGFQVASRMGLAVPLTSLRTDAQLGRISVQRFIPDARPANSHERRSIGSTPRGLRILALDFIARNPDRRAQNLLVNGGVVYPIDFNVAFDFGGDTPTWNEVAAFSGRWFGVAGIERLVFVEQDVILAEMCRVAHLIPDHYLERAAGAIEPAFLDARARAELVAGLRRRRDALVPSMTRWLAETVRPLRQLLIGESSCHTT